MAKVRMTDLVEQKHTGQHYVRKTENALIPQDRASSFAHADERRIVEISIPLTAQPLPTEFVFHVDCKLTPQQSTVARRIAQQLDFQNACLNNGQRIVNVHGALKWLLEQVAKQLD